MQSAAIWMRQSKKVEVELSLEIDALRIYRLPSRNGVSVFPFGAPASNGASVFPFGTPASNDQTSSENHQDLLAAVFIEDIIGCHRMKGRLVDDRSSYFTVYAYPYGKVAGNNKIESGPRPVNGTNGSKDGRINGIVKKRRQRDCYTFQIEGKHIYADNAAYAKNWVDIIRSRIEIPKPAHVPFNEFVLGYRRRRLYVIVNPHSGPGKALEIFQDHVMPVLAEAKVACRLLVTEKCNQALHLIRGLSLEEWDGIVIVSGDGLVFEVINGLASRSDRDQALKIPIGVIPGGSGNALAAAACFPPGETVKGNFAVDAAVAVARPNYRPLRLIRVEIPGRNLWSFLSVGWGLLSDIDIESERFRRSLGSARFTAGGLIRVFNLRKYRARISYLPAEDAPSSAVTSSRSGPDHSQDGTSAVESGGSQSVGMNGHRNSAEDEEGPARSRFDKLHRTKSAFQYSNGNGSSENGSELLAATPSTDTPEPHVQVRFDLDVSLNQNDVSSRDCDDIPCLHPDDRQGDIVTMPSLDEPVPSDWKVIEDELILFYAVYLDRIGAEAPYAPICGFDDDCMYLTFIRASSVTKAQVAKFLFAIEKAEHFNMPFFETIPVKAFRLDRLSCGPSDIVAVDGELISDVNGPIQACVTNYRATIMTST